MTFNTDDGDGWQSLHTNQILDRWQYSVVSGCAVSINTGTLGQGDTLSVASGDAIFGGSDVSVASQSVQIDTANSSHPRKDVVYLDGSGTAQVANGTAEAPDPAQATRFETFRPAPSDLSATDAVVLATVWVPAGASSVGSADVRDRRILADLAAADLGGVDVSDGGTVVVSEPGDINFATDLDVTDDGDGTVTVASTASSASGVPDTHFMAANGADATGGSAVDSTFSNLISNADAGDTIVFESGGTYVLQNQHLIGKPITLDFSGATIELQGITDDPQIHFVPDTTNGMSGCIEATTDLGADVAEGDLTISVADSSIFSRGDYMVVWDTGSVATGSGTDNEHHIQYARVESVPDASTVEMSVAAHTELAASSESGQVARLSIMEKPKIMGGDIISGSGAGDGWPFQFSFCVNPVFEDVSIKDHLKHYFLMSECWGGRIVGCDASQPQTTGSGEAEMIYLRRCADTRVQDCRVEKCRRGIDILAGTYNTHVENCKIYNFSNNAISVHQDNPAGFFHIEGCEIRGSDDSSFSSIGHGISGSNQLTELKVENCVIQATRDGVSAEVAPTTGVATITGCTFLAAPYQSSGSGVEIRSSNTKVADCIFNEEGASEWSQGAIHADPAAAIEDITIEGTFKIDGGDALVHLETNNAAINDVTIDGVFRSAETGTTAGDIMVRVEPINNPISNVDISIDVDETTDHAVFFAMGNSAGLGGTVRIHDCHLRTTGSDRHPINFGGDSSNSAKTVIISDNYCYGTATDYVIDVDQPVDNLVIHDNVIETVNTTDGITPSGSRQATREQIHHNTVF